jgi:hypothetical protein
MFAINLCNIKTMQSHGGTGMPQVRHIFRPTMPPSKDSDGQAFADTPEAALASSKWTMK